MRYGKQNKKMEKFQLSTPFLFSTATETSVGSNCARVSARKNAFFNVTKPFNLLLPGQQPRPATQLAKRDFEGHRTGQLRSLRP